MNRWFDFDRHQVWNAVASTFLVVFVGVLAVLLALWLVAAVIVGTAELAGMVS